MLKFDIVSRDGESEVVTVFFGGGVSEVATKEHPNFAKIVEYLEDGSYPADDVRDLFDVSHAIDRSLISLSERSRF